MVDSRMTEALKAEKRRYDHAVLTIQQNWDRGKKRTCPGCGETFLTRKDKRIHRKATSGRCEPVEKAFKYA